MNYTKEIIEIYNSKNLTQHIPHFRDTVLRECPNAADYVDTVLTDDNIRDHILKLVSEREDTIFLNMQHNRFKRRPKFIGETEYDFFVTDTDYHKSIYTTLANDIRYYQCYGRLMYAKPLHSEDEAARDENILELDRIAYDILLELRDENIIESDVDSYLLLSDETIYDCLKYYEYSDGEQPEIIKKYFRKEFIACLKYNGYI